VVSGNGDHPPSSFRVSTASGLRLLKLFYELGRLLLPPLNAESLRGINEGRLKLIHNRSFWQLSLVMMLVPLAVIAYWPSPVDQPVQGQLADFLSFLQRHGIPHWFNYKFVEAAANVILFVPLGFVSFHAFSCNQWWRVAAFGLAVSGFMELGQLLFLHDRFASSLDLMTNMSGTIVGSLGARIVVKRLEARSRPAAGLQ
jgi:VanZ family protein